MTRGRPRRAGADEEILATAIALLREQGYRALTLDAIAERAGVAKTTIYRRWPSKAALIAAALGVAPPPAEHDAEAIVRETAELLALLGEVDADAIDVVRAIVGPRRARLRELGADADALLGPLVLRAVLSAEC